VIFFEREKASYRLHKKDRGKIKYNNRTYTL
jgi:hypothetical protein